MGWIINYKEIGIKITQKPSQYIMTFLNHDFIQWNKACLALSGKASTLETQEQVVPKNME